MGCVNQTSDTCGQFLPSPSDFGISGDQIKGFQKTGKIQARLTPAPFRFRVKIDIPQILFRLRGENDVTHLNASRLWR